MPGAQAQPEVSIIVPTVGRRRALSRCLEALARERSTAAMEVIVANDGPTTASNLLGELQSTLCLREVIVGGRGPAAARNAGAAEARGEVLLFLDDDLVILPGLIRQHLERHASCFQRVVVGYSRPRPIRQTWSALDASLWWDSHFRATHDTTALDFRHILGGNISVRKTVFERVGGYNEEFGRFRREDWEWGIRMLGAGAEAVYAPAAIADHEFGLDFRRSISAARAEGAGDALITRQHPSAAQLLPRRPCPGQPIGGALVAALRRRRSREALFRLLAALEKVKARRAWLALSRAVSQAAYEDGFAAVRRL